MITFLGQVRARSFSCRFYTNRHKQERTPLKRGLVEIAPGRGEGYLHLCKASQEGPSLTIHPPQLLTLCSGVAPITIFCLSGWTGDLNLTAGENLGVMLSNAKGQGLYQRSWGTEMDLIVSGEKRQMGPPGIAHDLRTPGHTRAKHVSPQAICGHVPSTARFLKPLTHMQEF